MSELRDQRKFFQYLAGNFVTLSCVWMQRVALLWIAWELTESFMWAGIISLLQLMPTILFGPIFGVKADRWSTVTAMIAVQVVFLVLGMVVYIFEISGLLSVWLLSAMAFAIGVTTSAHHPLRMSLTPSLVSKAFLPKAIALDSINFNLTRMLGPAIGGATIAKWGVASALLVGAIGYLPLICALAYLPRLDAAHAPRTKLSFWNDFVLALNVIKTDARILKAMLITALYGFFARGFVELFPAVADGSFRQGAVGAGQLMAAAGIGALSGAVFLMIGLFPGAKPRQKLADVSAIISFVALGAMIAVADWGFALLGAAILGFSGAIVGVVNQTAIQTNILAKFQGRIMSIWTMLTVGSTAIGALAYGAVSDLSSVFSAALSGAVCGGLSILYISTRKPAISAQYELDPPQPKSLKH